MPPAAELPAVTMRDDLQLELFAGESCENGPESAPQGQSGIHPNNPPPAEATGRAERAGAAILGAVPATCPVVGKPVCYRGDCRHYQSGACAHPAATAKPAAPAPREAVNERAH